MTRASPYQFKIATEPWEFEAIHRLNYQTFVEEIPQHEHNGSGKLVDKFHEQNTYLICLRDRRLVGMLALRAQRPFSLDAKLDNLDAYLPPSRSVCEIRLLSIDREHRGRTVLGELLHVMAGECLRLGHDAAIISATLRQRKLYQRMGFVPFGPVVGTPDAPYQPMVLTHESYQRHCAEGLRCMNRRGRGEPRSLMPGPVAISPRIKKALASPPIPHRCDEFKAEMGRVKGQLCRLVGAKHVEVLMGPATVANDAIAAQLSLMSEPGLILSNGEFGERLVDHATRFGLRFDAVKLEWGRVIDRGVIRGALRLHRQARWLWAVHCETSTGVLNDLDSLKHLCMGRGIRLCLDCVSSVGAVPIDLAGVHLASATSGKGLGAFPGLAMVFYNEPLASQPQRLPRSLDLGYYAAHDGIPFTVCSNLVSALGTALVGFESPDRHGRIVEDSTWLRPRIRRLGLEIVAPPDHACPAIITINLPRRLDSRWVGGRAREAGLLLSHQSQYLINRNWVQVCLMGSYSRDDLARLVDFLEGLVAEVPPPVSSAPDRPRPQPASGVDAPELIPSR